MNNESSSSRISCGVIQHTEQGIFIVFFLLESKMLISSCDFFDDHIAIFMLVFDWSLQEMDFSFLLHICIYARALLLALDTFLGYWKVLLDCNWIKVKAQHTIGSFTRYSIHEFTKRPHSQWACCDKSDHRVRRSVSIHRPCTKLCNCQNNDLLCLKQFAFPHHVEYINHRQSDTDTDTDTASDSDTWH